MIRERLDSYCEKGVLALVLAVLVFGPLATGAVRPFEFLIIQGLTIAAVLLWTLRFWLNPGHRLLWPPICWAVIAFVLYAIARYQRADIEYVARQELIRVLLYALLFFLVLNNLAHQESAQLATFVMVFLVMVISMFAIYQFATNSEYVWHFIKPAVFRKRGSGTYINPNDLAGFLEMLVPLGLAYTLAGRLNHLLRVFLGYASLVMLTGIGVTLSRGAWAATGVALALFFALLIRRREYRIPALIVLAALTAASFYFYSKADRVQKRLHNVVSTTSPDSTQIRLWLWEPTLQMWKDHPWFGVGPAHFDYRFPRYRPEEVQDRAGFAHNDYLNTLADWGVVGAVLVAAAFALLYASVFKTWKVVSRDPSAFGTKPSNRAAFVLGASIGLLAILIHSFTDFNMHVPANAILAVALMALLAGHLRYATECIWLDPGWAGRLAATFIGLAAISYLGRQGWRRGNEYAWLNRADQERLLQQTNMAELKKNSVTNSPSPEFLRDITASTERYLFSLKQAAAVEPMNFETTYNLGEALRQLSFQGNDDYEKLASQAIEWLQRGRHLNPYAPLNYMKIGMCLDWLGRHDEAGPYFEKAVQCDPNNYYVLAHQGWHLVQIGDYAAAKPWLVRSLRLQHPWHNPYAAGYLSIVERELKKQENLNDPGKRPGRPRMDLNK